MNTPAVFRNLSVRFIAQAIADEFGVTWRELLGSERRAELIEAREVLFWLARTITGRSYPAIGRDVGGRDHATVFRAVREIDERRAADADFAARTDGLVSAIKTVTLSRYQSITQEPDAFAAARKVLTSPAAGAVEISTIEVRAIAGRLLDSRELLDTVVLFLAAHRKVNDMHTEGNAGNAGGGARVRFAEQQLAAAEAALISELGAAGYSIELSGDIHVEEEHERRPEIAAAK